VGQEDEGGAGGNRTSVVFVQATRRVEREEEFFANYGDSFRFPHGCQCHLCAATAALHTILFRNGNLTSALAGRWRRLWARSGCGGSGRAPGWCGWAVASLLRRCCGGTICWRPVISLLAQSVVVGEVG